VERDFTPKLISGIGRWELFPGTFIIGNAELDRYIRVPSESVEPVWRTVQCCDGHRSIPEIAGLMLGSGCRLDVAGLYDKLADAGLLVGSEYISDVSRVSVTWFEAQIGGLLPAWRGWRLLSRLLIVATCVSMLAAGAVWLRGPLSTVGIWKASAWKVVVATLAGAFVSIFIHEAGHALAARAEGLRPERLRLLGYLGVIPYLLLSIPGLYTIRPAGRVRVWLAGPLASLQLASLSYLALGLHGLPLPALVWLDRMTRANLMLAVVNACPLLPTDGYFIASTLLRQANWRIRSWRELSICVRRRRRPQIMLLLYALASSIVLAVLTIRTVVNILSVTNFSWFGFGVVLLLILTLVFKRMTLQRRKAARFMGGI
jgi:Zn-dependent protease